MAMVEAGDSAGVDLISDRPQPLKVKIAQQEACSMPQTANRGA